MEEQKQSFNKSFSSTQAFFNSELKSLLENQELFKCKGNNLAVSVCTQSSCLKPGLQCINLECQCHTQKIHQQCDSCYLSKILKGLLKKQKQIPYQVKQSSSFAIKIINKMIDDLSQLRSQIENRQQYFGLFNQERQFVDLVKQNKIDQINGKLISSMKPNLKKQIKIKFISKQQAQMFFKDKIAGFQKMCKQISIQYEIKLKKNFKTNLNLFSDTKILNNLEDLDLLAKWIQQIPENPQNSVIQSKLLFRASEHQFKIDQFHKYCDNKNDTIIIIKNQHDKIFGSYSHAKWSSNQGYVEDQTKKSFLFFLTEIRQKVACSDYKLSIQLNIDGQLLFGNQDWTDLSIVDKANTGYSFLQPFGNYNLNNTNNKYQDDKDTQYKLLGANNNYCFKIKQYEVYQIIMI